jgi:hypothetical protein
VSVRRVGFHRTTLPRLSPSAYNKAVLADSPWGFWPGDETTGTTIADLSGNSRNLSITGSPTLGRAGPGNTSGISWPSSSGTEHYGATSANFASSAATLAGWVYLTATPTAKTPIVACAQSYGVNTMDKALYVDTDGKPKFMVFSGSAVTAVGSSALSLNAWHHVVASVGAAGVILRVDKATAGTASATSSYSGNQLVFVHGGGSDPPSSLVFTDGSAAVTGPCAVWASQLTTVQSDAHYDAAF